MNNWLRRYHVVEAKLWGIQRAFQNEERAILVARFLADTTERERVEFFGICSSEEHAILVDCLLCGKDYGEPIGEHRRRKAIGAA